MLSERRRLVVVLLVSALAIRGTFAAEKEPAPEKATAVGRVVDERGRGVAGARLIMQAWRDPDRTAEALSDEGGRFVFQRLDAACRNRLLVDAEGFGRTFVEHIDLFPGHATDVGEICLSPGCVCRGRVLGADGQPVAAVEVTVTAYSHELGHTIVQLGAPWQVKTDEQGRFHTPPLPVSYVGFDLAPPAGFVQDISDHYPSVYLEPGHAEMVVEDIRLVPEAPLEGIVVSETGHAVIGAEVWHTYGRGKTSSTDTAGRFALRGCSEKTIKKTIVGVESVGFASFRDKKPGGELPRRIVLSPCTYISGRAIDAETGDPVKIKRVVVCEVRRDADGTPQSYGCGEARFTQPTPGQFRAAVSTRGEKHLTIMAEGYEHGYEYVLGAAAEANADVTVKLRRKGSAASAAGQRITGHVCSKEQPAAGVWVSLWQKKTEWDAVNATVERGRTVDGTYRPWAIDVLTRDDGEYLIDVPDPGEYYVVATPREGAVASSPALKVGVHEEVTCDLDLRPGGTIRGRVVGVAPKVAARLSVIAFGHIPYREAVPVGRDGQFSLTDVPAGEIGLKVGHEGYLDTDVQRFPVSPEQWEQLSQPWRRAAKVLVAPGHTVEGIALELPPPGPVDRPEE